MKSSKKREGGINASYRGLSMMLCVGFGLANGLYLATIFDQVLRIYNSCNVLEFVNYIIHAMFWNLLISGLNCYTCTPTGDFYLC